jgi:hypothetical protein
MKFEKPQPSLAEGRGTRQMYFQTYERLRPKEEKELLAAA